MSDFVHSPNYYRRTGKTGKARTPQKSTGKVRIATSAVAIRATKTINNTNTTEPKHDKEANKTAEAIHAILKEDLPNYQIEVKAQFDSTPMILINTIPPPTIVRSWQMWMFSIDIRDSCLDLTRHHNLDLMLTMGFALEDPTCFENLVNQIKAWTNLELVDIIDED